MSKDMTAPLLSVERLTMRFGGLAAIDDLSLDVPPGKITGVKKGQTYVRFTTYNGKSAQANVTILGVPTEIHLDKSELKLGVGDAKRVLVLTDGNKETVFRSFRNLPNVEVLPFRQASAYDVKKARQVVIEASALTAGQPAEEVVNA